MKEQSLPPPQPTLEQLKVAAYDHLVQIEYLQRRLQQLNQAIVNFKSEPVQPVEPKPRERQD